MLGDFRQFIARGNVIDLAVAVIIGAAFGRIVTSLVNDMLMPPIGMMLGSMDFTNFFLALDGGRYESLAAAEAAGAATVNYGRFVNIVIEFFFVALAVFVIVRQVNRLKSAPVPAPEAEARDCPFCISRIPLKATRCAFCTSHLDSPRAPA